MHYSLGLLLTEVKKHTKAARHLRRAATGMPERARAHYNHGLLLQHRGKDADAEKSLRQARELEPDNFDYPYALADFYLKRSQLPQARRIAQEMVAWHPTQQIGHDILNLIKNNSGTGQN